RLHGPAGGDPERQQRSLHRQRPRQSVGLRCPHRAARPRCRRPAVHARQRAAPRRRAPLPGEGAGAHHQAQGGAGPARQAGARRGRQRRHPERERPAGDRQVPRRHALDPARAARGEARAQAGHRPARRLAQVHQHRAGAAADRRRRARVGDAAAARRQACGWFARQGRRGMKPRSFAALAIITVVALVVAIATYATQNRWSQAKVSGDPLFPGLAAQAGKVARIEIRQGDKSLVLARDKDSWSLADRSGYPAKTEAVRALLVKLAGAELVETKTQKQGRYALLELEDPSGKDAKSRLLRLTDDKGAVIAEAVIGKKRYDAFGA